MLPPWVTHGLHRQLHNTASVGRTGLTTLFFHPFWVEGGQKSNGFISVPSFIGLLLEVCSWGCDSSRDILRRQVYLCRLGKALSGELVWPRVDFRLFTSCKRACVYIHAYVYSNDWLPKLKNVMLQLQDRLLEWPLPSFTDHNDMKWHSVVEWWWMGVTYFPSKTMTFFFFSLPPGNSLLWT